MRFILILFALLPLIGLAPFSFAQSQIETRVLNSDAFDGNLIGVSPDRSVQIYLPDGYDGSSHRYPVIYYLHTFFEDEATFFGHQNGKELLDKAISSQRLGDVIVVVADFNTPVGGSLYTNSPVTGQWRDFMIDELVPYIDSQYRTLAQRESRGIVGFQAGAYGAIRFASRHPDVFGLVYGLHPVATGFGHILMQSRPDWEKLESLTSLEELKGDGLSEIFTAIYQANLPDPNNPPLYFDPPATRVNGNLVMDVELTDKLQDSFFLERQVGQYAENMKTLIAFKFDWGRHDGNQDHVYSNQFYSRKLNEYGVPHEADEYNGGWGDKTFDEQGRFNSDVIPFFQQHLEFDRVK